MRIISHYEYLQKIMYCVKSRKLQSYARTYQDQKNIHYEVKTNYTYTLKCLWVSPITFYFVSTQCIFTHGTVLW